MFCLLRVVLSCSPLPVGLLRPLFLSPCALCPPHVAMSLHRPPRRSSLLSVAAWPSPSQVTEYMEQRDEEFAALQHELDEGLPRPPSPPSLGQWRRSALVERWILAHPHEASLSHLPPTLPPHPGSHLPPRLPW